MKPDFAFPKKVAADAKIRLDQALKNHKDAEALRAAMDMSIASTLISNENVGETISLLDSLLPSLKTPYKAIDYLIQANVYNAIYESDPYSFNNRTVDAGMAHQNPLFWDRNLFKEKILSLVDLALAEKKEASKTPLSGIDILITKSYPNEGFTIYDFIVYQALNLMEDFKTDGIIPFYKKEAEEQSRPMELVEGLLSLHPTPSGARTTAILEKARMLPQEEGAEYLWKEIQTMQDSPQVRDLVISFFNNFPPTADNDLKGSPSTPTSVVTTDEFYTFLKQLQEKKKDKNSDGWIDEIICQITRPIVSLYYPSDVVPGNEFEVNIETSNLNDFYVLLINAGNNKLKDISPEQLNNIAKVVDCRKVTFTKALPFKDKETLKFKVTEPGNYAVIASSSMKCIDVITNDKKVYITTFEASAIDIFSASERTEDDSKNSDKQIYGCYVVNSKDGSPIENVSVEFINQGIGYYDKTKGKSVTKKTNASGFAPSAFDYAEAQVNYKGSKASIRTYKNRTGKGSEYKRLKLFTDQQVYRPGDKVSFFGIYYEIDQAKNDGRLLKNEPVVIKVENANRETVDTISCISDNSGRIFAEFQLPNDGLLGTWFLRTDHNIQDFEVAAYKVPNIFVSLSKTESAPDSISFEGIVSTFSGMPVQDTKVFFNVEFTPYRFYWFGYNSFGSLYSQEPLFVILLKASDCFPTWERLIKYLLIIGFQYYFLSWL